MPRLPLESFKRMLTALYHWFVVIKRMLMWTVPTIPRASNLQRQYNPCKTQYIMTQPYPNVCMKDPDLNP